LTAYDLALEANQANVVKIQAETVAILCEALMPVAPDHCRGIIEAVVKRDLTLILNPIINQEGTNA
jgi:hypothetical protein